MTAPVNVPVGGGEGEAPTPTGRQLKPCGTHAAFVRHWSHSEEPCEACKQAERLYQRDRFRSARRVEPEVVASLCLTSADAHLSRCGYCGEWRWAEDDCRVCAAPFCRDDLLRETS